MKKTLVLLGVCLVFNLVAGTLMAAGTIDCPNAQFHGKARPHKNIVPVGKYLVWIVLVNQETDVEITFVEKQDVDDGGSDGKGESPFVGNENPIRRTITQNGQKFPSDVVAESAEDAKYGYKITCTTRDGKKTEIDPIIEVPKGVH